MSHKDKPLEGRFSLLIDREQGTRVEVRDHLSGEVVVRVRVSLEETVAFLSRQILVDCEFTHGEFERVGKKMENKSFEFEMPEDVGYGDERKEIATKLALKECPAGWKPDCYFNSHDSFFTRYLHPMARCTIRRWV